MKPISQFRNNRSILYDSFKGETSLHGPWNIAAARGGLKKTFWKTVMVGAFVGCIYQVASILLQYYEYDVTVSQTITYQRQATFPAVTFCNMNPVKRSAVGDNLQLSSLSTPAPASRRKRSESDQENTADKDFIVTKNQSFVGQGHGVSRNKRTVYSCAKKAIYDRYVFGSYTTSPRLTEYCVINGDSTTTWSVASTACSGLGYQLAVVDTMDKVAFIWANLQWTITPLNPPRFWIGLCCSASGTFSWYDGTPYTSNNWLSVSSCSDQCVYGDAASVTWKAASATATNSILCAKDGSYSALSQFSCGYTSSVTDANGLIYQYCFVAAGTDNSTTWTQSQGVCLSLGYTAIVTLGSYTRSEFIANDDGNYFANGAKYWVGASVDTQADCLSHTYKWIDGAAFSWSVWSAGTTAWPTCTQSTPTFSPYGCVVAHTDLSRDLKIDDCRKSYSIICQRVTNSCQSNPCLNGATCNTQTYGYTCTCTSRYMGINCQTANFTTVAVTTQVAITYFTTQVLLTTLAKTTVSATTTSSLTIPADTTTLSTTPVDTTTLSTTPADTTTFPTTQTDTTTLSTTQADTTTLPTTQADTTTLSTTQTDTTTLPTTQTDTTTLSTTQTDTTTLPTIQTDTTTLPTTQADTTTLSTTQTDTTTLSTTQADTTTLSTTQADATTSSTKRTDTTAAATTTQSIKTFADTTQLPSTLQTITLQETIAQTADTPTSTLHYTSTIMTQADKVQTTDASSSVVQSITTTATIQQPTTAATTNGPTKQVSTISLSSSVVKSTISTSQLSSTQVTTKPTTAVPRSVEQTIQMLDTSTTFTSAISTATRSTTSSVKTTVSSTTPSLTDRPPTNAPLQGSSIPGRVAQNQQTQAVQQLTETLANMPTSEKQQLGYQANEFILDCQYAGYSCSPLKDFESFYNAIQGNCYIFNSGWNSSLSLLNVSKVGSRLALKVIMNIAQDEYIITGNEAAGARIVIHSQDSMPYPEDVGLLVKPGQLTSVHVSRTDFHRLPAPFGNCIHASTAPPDMNVYTELYPVKYDHIGCYRTCFQRHMIQTCGCADSSLPNNGSALYNGSYPYCNLTDMTQNDCNYNLTQQFVQNNLPCNCPLVCDEVQYNTYVTQSYWPTDVDKNSVLATLAPKIPSILDEPATDPNKYKRNLLRVEIYFDNLMLITVTESPAYSLEAVLTNLSACVGAWTGVACMTFCEVLDLASDYMVLAFFTVFVRHKTKELNKLKSPSH